MPVPVFTAGEVLTAANMNAVGLWRVTSCTVSSVGGTAATASNGVITMGNGNTSVTVSNAFSANFTNYLVSIDNFDISTAAGLYMTLGTTNSGYYFSGVVVSYLNGAVSGEYGNNTGWFVVGSVANGNGKTSTKINISQPHQAARTTYTAHGVDSRTDGAGNRTYSGFLNNTTQYTSMVFTPSGGNILSGTIRVYGFRD